jgi:hypothetical protein
MGKRTKRSKMHVQNDGSLATKHCGAPNIADNNSVASHQVAGCVEERATDAWYRNGD